MNYKVGDKVRIRKDANKVQCIYGGMLRMLGKVGTISAVLPWGYYFEECPYHAWNFESNEGLVKEEPEQILITISVTVQRRH